MTSSDDYAQTGYESDSGEVVVEIADEVPAEHRDAIKASVEALVRRSVEASRRAVEHGRAQNELLTAMARPLGKLLEADAAAADAVAAATRRLEEQRREPPSREPKWPTVRVVERPLAADASGFLADQVFGMPYHFKWNWWHGSGPVFLDVNRDIGRIAIQTHAGSGDRVVSDVHADFGVSLGSNTVQDVKGRSLRKTNHAWVVGAGNLGGNATVEGGMEMTVMQAGNLIDAAIDRRFRLRCTNGEDGSDETGGFETGDGSVEVEWTMHPNLTYQFNVGAYAFCDAYRGLAPFSGFSTSWARLEAQVIALTADFTE
jgi:hypothetical protein